METMTAPRSKIPTDSSHSLTLKSDLEASKAAYDSAALGNT